MRPDEPVIAMRIVVSVSFVDGLSVLCDDIPFATMKMFLSKGL